MKHLLECRAGHKWLEPNGGPNGFQKPHVPDCGARISMSHPIKPEEEKDIFHCKICQAPEIANYNTEIKHRLITKQICFACDFWQEKIQWRKNNKPDCYVIAGFHYKIEPDADPNDHLGKRWSGYGGSKFIVLPHNGTEIVTRNLWHQGEIPERFRDVLTDNAVFVNQQ